MTWDLAAGFAFGLTIAVLTSPVGVSGAVFLLPLQMSVLHVPSPAVTPTNLLYNVVAVPGALWRYRRAGTLRTDLTRILLAGTLPGVVAGALVRVYLLPSGTVFRVLVSVVLLPLGGWLLIRDGSPRRVSSRRLPPSAVAVIALAAGFVGGVYGIGGGSLLAPILSASGYLLADLAPAALLSTFVTSCVGAATYAGLQLFGQQAVGPKWPLGLACGLGGLVGGYIGAGLQPHLPHRALRLLLGVVAVCLSIGYLIAAERA